VRAAEWLAAHRGAARVLVMERDEAWGRDGAALLQRASGCELASLDPLAVSRERVEGPTTEEETLAKQRYLRDQLGPADILVLTDNNRRRLAGLRDEFPVMARFYDDLLAGRTAFGLAAETGFEWQLGDLRVDDSRAEPSFRMYDHPRVYVFVRERGMGAGRGSTPAPTQPRPGSPRPSPGPRHPPGGPGADPDAT